METRFATQSGCVRNTATVNKAAPAAQSQASSASTTPATAASGLGGQIGELTAALNVIGWNHNQVPADERIPLQEKL